MTNPELADGVTRRERFHVVLGDYEGTEGPVAVATSEGVFPLVTSKDATLETLMDAARAVAIAENRVVTVVTFSHREDLVSYGPDGQEVPLDVHH